MVIFIFLFVFIYYALREVFVKLNNLEQNLSLISKTVSNLEDEIDGSDESEEEIMY